MNARDLLKIAVLVACIVVGGCQTTREADITPRTPAASLGTFNPDAQLDPSQVEVPVDTSAPFRDVVDDNTGVLHTGCRLWLGLEPIVRCEDGYAVTVWTQDD